jgi:heme/copper-type cytochrome/quinol oxidase subunit 2
LRLIPPPSIPLTLEQHRFTPAEVRVKAKTPVVLVVTNKDATEEEFEIATLRIEKIIPGGKKVQIKLPAMKPGTYEFVGEYHEETAKRRLIVE